MAQTQGWSDPLIAQAALNDPTTATFDLLAICMAQPQLRAGAALHPNADVNLLTWIAGQDEPVAAATASSRLAQAPTPIPQAQPEFQTPHAQPQFQAPQASAMPAFVATVPAAKASGRGGARVALLAGAGVLALALVATAVVVLLPRMGAAGQYEYAPDLREEPGLVAVDAQSGLPKGDYEWSTSFYPAPDAGYLVASNASSAYEDYQSELTTYNESLSALKQWESDYQSGYSSGQSCLNGTDDMSYYSSRAAYCSDYRYDYLTIGSSGAEAGFLDSVNGFPASPDHPGNSNYAPPQVPAKPSEPTAGGNLVGIDVQTGKSAWQLELSSIWADARPRLLGLYPSGDQALVLMDDLAKANSDKPAPRKLALLYVKTGIAGPSAELDGEGSSVVKLHGDVAIVTDDDGTLRALSTSDLTTEKWTSSAHSYWWNSDESPYWISEIPGGYLLTDEGYISMADGKRADFAREAGQDSIQLGPLTGTTDKLIRLQGTESGHDVSGFDPATDEQTWKLTDVYPDVRMAGGLLIVPSSGEVTAYRIKGDELERQWRYTCEKYCGVSFVDDARVIVSEWDSSAVVILNTADGEEIDSVKNADGSGVTMGRTVLYLEQGKRLIARDLSKSGLPTLWRSIQFDGSLSQVGEHLLIEGNGSASGKVGILGLDGDDWNEFRVKEG